MEIIGREDNIPIYISLRRLESRQLELSLLKTIQAIYEYEELEIKIEDIKNTLYNGKAIILIDGLDVNDKDQSFYIEQVDKFINDYPKNTFIIATKTEKPIFKDFVVYGLIDFDSNERINFIEKWYINKNDLEYVKLHDNLINYLNSSNEADITNISNTLEGNPLILSCLCVIYAKKMEIKYNSNSLLLYQSAMQELVENWDKDRQIDFEYAYKVLHPEQKKKLLAYIAISFMKLADFKTGTYLPKNNVKQFIIEFIRQPNIKITLDEYGNKIPLEDNFRAECILHTIEIQDGILVEKVTDEYSFIHSTIQKYFVSYYLSTCDIYEWDNYLKYKSKDFTIFEDAIQLRDWNTSRLQDKFLNSSAIKEYSAILKPYSEDLKINIIKHMTGIEIKISLLKDRKRLNLEIWQVTPHEGGTKIAFYKCENGQLLKCESSSIANISPSDIQNWLNGKNIDGFLKEIFNFIHLAYKGG